MIEHHKEGESENDLTKMEGPNGDWGLSGDKTVWMDENVTKPETAEGGNKYARNLSSALKMNGIKVRRRFFDALWAGQ